MLDCTESGSFRPSPFLTRVRPCPVAVCRGSLLWDPTDKVWYCTLGGPAHVPDQPRPPRRTSQNHRKGKYE